MPFYPQPKPPPRPKPGGAHLNSAMSGTFPEFEPDVEPAFEPDAEAEFQPDLDPDTGARPPARTSSKLIG